MKDESVGGVHWSFWIIGAVALIWNVMGFINFFGQMNADALAAMPKAQRAIIEGRPAWATGAFAIAVFGGALGCLLLLLRKSAAYLFVHRVATWRHCATDPYPWHCQFDNRLQSLRHLDDYSDAAGGGGVFDLVFEADREEGLDQLGATGRGRACREHLGPRSAARGEFAGVAQW